MPTKIILLVCFRYLFSYIFRYSYLSTAILTAALPRSHQVLPGPGEDACVCLAVAVYLACFQACSSDAAVHSFVGPYQPQTHKPGTRLLMPNDTPVTKNSMRRVLAIISRLYPLARPTRGMLKQVFNFFEPPHNVAAAAAAAAASGDQP